MPSRREAVGPTVDRILRAIDPAGLSAGQKEDLAVAVADVVEAARRLVARWPAVREIVLECTNMPPYAADIQRETGLPVFDIVSLVTMVHTALAVGQPPRPA